MTSSYVNMRFHFEQTYSNIETGDQYFCTITFINFSVYSNLFAFVVFPRPDNAILIQVKSEGCRRKHGLTCQIFLYLTHVFYFEISFFLMLFSIFAIYFRLLNNFLYFSKLCKFEIAFPKIRSYNAWAYMMFLLPFSYLSFFDCFQAIAI